MRDIRVAAAQFEHRDGDKAYNLVAHPRPDPPRGGAGGRDRQLPRVLHHAATRSSSTSTASSSPGWPSRSPTGRRSAP